VSKKRVFYAASCALLLTVGSAQAFVGLAVRVGCAYVGYKFVDGVVGCSISHFVDQYKSGVIDGICAFGKGVQSFGGGVRSVAVDFWYDKSDNSFSTAWQGITSQFGDGVLAMQSEWETRRSVYHPQKTKSLVGVGDEVVSQKPGPSETVAKKGRPKERLKVVT